MKAILVHSELTPALTNGSVIPATGINPTFIPILSVAWKKNIPAAQIAIIWPN